MKAWQKSGISVGCYDTIETWAIWVYLIAIKGDQRLGLKQSKALQTISEWCIDRNKELEHVMVKYELTSDWIVSKMNPYMVMIEP